MKEPIDHVLPWVRPEIRGMDLARIISRELHISIEDAIEQLKERHRFDPIPRPVRSLVKPAQSKPKKHVACRVKRNPSVAELAHRYRLKQVGFIA